MNIITRHAVFSAVFAAALVGCDKTDETIDPPQVSHEVGLRRLTSCDDLKTRVTDSIIESVVQGYGFRGYPGGVMEDAVDAPAADNTAGGGDGATGPSSWTGTNNQEEGVEELDLVQTDGEHLYVAQDKWLQIVDSFPAEAASLQASVQLDGYARGLFQADATTLVVVEDLGGETTPDGAWIPLTRARVVDVTDPTAPVTTRTVDLEGWLVDARMIDAQVYLVLQQPMDVPYTVWEGGYTALNTFTWPAWDAGEAEWAAARAQARALVAPAITNAMAALSSDDLLPQSRADGGAFSAMYQCGDLYEPAQNTQLAMLGVSQIDPSSGLIGASGILSDGWIVYASQTALYVAQTSWWWFGWSDEAVSHIHKFDLSGAAPAYVASGEVTGWLYDQFAMSEFNGYLRAVSTQFGVSSGGVAVSDGGVATDVAPPEASDSPDASGGSTGGSDGSTGAEVPPDEGDQAEPVDPVDPVDPPAVDPNAPANPSGPKKGGSSTLRLPTTTVSGAKSQPGGPKPPADESLDEAVEEQRELLVEFDKISDELNKVLANLEGSTLVKRLKAASRKQYDIAGRLGDQVSVTFGRSGNVADDKAKRVLGEMSVQESQSSQDVSNIMDDLQSYFERRRLAKFRTVLDEMRKVDVVGNLRTLADELRLSSGLAIAQAEYWSDNLDRWSEDLVDAAKGGDCPGCKSRGSLPPSIVLEVMQILEAEVNLREETRVAEQAKPAVPADEHRNEAELLSKTQSVLQDRSIKVRERIAELPEAQELFGKELALMQKVAEVMGEATSILSQPNTGNAAMAAETEAIELLLATRRIKPGGGGGGGSTPGGGGTGTTKDAAIALLGRGVNEKEVREDRGVTASSGEAGQVLPEEFRSGLDEYFNRIDSK